MGGRNEPAGEYIFPYRKENENNELGTGFFVRKRIISAVKRVLSFSDRLSYIILRGHWCHNIVLNVNGLIEEEFNVVKGSFHEEQECLFNKFQISIRKCLENFNVKASREYIYKPKIANESLH
jgi:hypothetical protein